MLNGLFAHPAGHFDLDTAHELAAVYRAAIELFRSLLERLLRAQVFNRAFEGFDYYYVTIEDNQLQADGSREVTAVARGRFLQNTKRMKVLFLIVGNQVIGGQVLEGTGLPPCLAPEEGRTS